MRSAVPLAVAERALTCFTCSFLMPAAFDGPVPTPPSGLLRPVGVRMTQSSLGALAFGSSLLQSILASGFEMDELYVAASSSPWRWLPSNLQGLSIEKNALSCSTCSSRKGINMHILYTYTCCSMCIYVDTF